MFICSRAFGTRPIRRRWMLPAAVSAVEVIAALLQLTPWAIFPADRTAALARHAAAMVLTTAILWLILRRADKADTEDEQPR